MKSVWTRETWTGPPNSTFTSSTLFRGHVKHHLFSFKSVAKNEMKKALPSFDCFTELTLSIREQEFTINYLLASRSVSSTLFVFRAQVNG